MVVYGTKKIGVLQNDRCGSFIKDLFDLITVAMAMDNGSFFKCDIKIAGITADDSAIIGLTPPSMMIFFRPVIRKAIIMAS